MSWIFYPPEGEEWFKQPQNEDVEPGTKNIKIKPKPTEFIEKPFETKNMRPYQSPPHSVEQIQPVRQEHQKWGSYKGKTASSYEEHHQQHKDEGDTTSTTTATNLIPPLSNDVTPKRATPIAAPEVLPSTSRSNPSRYVIPKVSRPSLQSNKLNELVENVSPPARPILPRPPSLPRMTLSKNISGTRSNKRRR